MAVYMDRYAKSLYAAEQGVPSGTVFPSMGECRAYADQIVGSDFWKKVCPGIRSVSVFSTKSDRFSYSKARYADIYLAHWGWNQRVIIHEMTHLLVASRHAGYHGHDGYFLYWLAMMIREFMGGDAILAFAKGCQAQGLDPLTRANECERENSGRIMLATVKETNSDYVPLTKNIYDTHVPVATVHREVVARGRSLSSFVKAFGGNKSLTPPINEHWRVTYAGGQRWLPKTCLERIELDLKLASPRAGVPRGRTGGRWDY